MIDPMSEHSSERARGTVVGHADHDCQVRIETTAEHLYRSMAANTFVTLYWRRELLDQSIARLRGEQFAVVEVDASGWATDEALHHDIAAALDFPDYYGRNLDALNDCLRDVVNGHYGVPEDAAGFVLAFTHYDRFTRASPRTAQIVLDILADHGRHAAVFGQRVLCLVHSDDPDITFQRVGGMPVMWNQAEWLTSRRRPEANQA
jgi:hypothetical protein